MLYLTPDERNEVFSDITYGTIEFKEKIQEKLVFINYSHLEEWVLKSLKTIVNPKLISILNDFTSYLKLWQDEPNEYQDSFQSLKNKILFNTKIPEDIFSKALDYISNNWKNVRSRKSIPIFVDWIWYRYEVIFDFVVSKLNSKIKQQRNNIVVKHQLGLTWFHFPKIIVTKRSWEDIFNIQFEIILNTKEKVFSDFNTEVGIGIQETKANIRELIDQLSLTNLQINVLNYIIVFKKVKDPWWVLKSTSAIIHEMLAPISVYNMTEKQQKLDNNENLELLIDLLYNLFMTIDNDFGDKIDKIVKKLND